MSRATPDLDRHELAEQLAQRDLALKNALLLIDKLKVELTYLRRMQYGRASEKLDHATQMSLLGESSQPEAAPAPQDRGNAANDESTAVGIQGSTRGRRPSLREGLRELPAHLPREMVVHEPPNGCQCADCGKKLRQIGQDISEVLDYVPGQFKVICHVRPRLACGPCARIVQAAAPSRPVDRGMAGAGLRAHVLVSKYADHTPLYRLSQIYARQGVDLGRSTLTDLVGDTACLLTPLAQAIGRHVLCAQKVHTDDTPIRVLGGKGNKARTGRLWVYVRDDRPAADQAPPAVWFQYSPNRKGEHPRRHLGRYSGILQADAFAGYDRLFDSGDIVEAACWAHARRKFYDIHERDHKLPGTLAHQALVQIGKLFAIEAEIRGRPPDERRQQRQARTQPLLAALHAWLNTTLAQLSAKSPMALAIGYSLSNWQALTHFVHDGRIEAHNNAAEQALRGVAVGRKNYLHLGSDSGGERAAVIYTILGTAKLNGLDPYAYLRRVIECIADHPINRINDLLPWAMDMRDAAPGEQVQPQPLAA